MRSKKRERLSVASKDVPERLTITIPKSLRDEMRSQATNSDESESGFICELLRRVLNVAGEGMPSVDTSHLSDLNRSLNWFLHDGDQKTSEQSGTPSGRAMEALRKGKFHNVGLKSAVPWYVLSALTNSERLASAVESQDVFIPEVKYSSEKVSRALIGQTFQWAHERLFGLNFKQIATKPDAFDAIINLEFALSAKTIFPFPCFQTEFRRDLFGLVPYASHVAIGWLFHENNPLTDLFQLKKEFKYHAWRMRPEDAAKRLEFLSRLFECVSKGQIELFVKDNYLNREVLPLLKSNAPHGLLISTFSDEKRFVNIISNDSKWPPDGHDAKICVLLYDLFADRKLASDSEGSNFLQIRFLHDQDIPVGIGFSLPTLPLMAREIPAVGKTVADVLRQQVQDVIKADASRFEEEFWNDGILLDEDLRANKNQDKVKFSEEMCKKMFNTTV